MTTQTTKFVIVEAQGGFRTAGRYVAVRGLAFETREAAQAHLDANERRFRRAHVETRTVKADDTNERKHCQCCFRPILSKRGLIAHHGYERPEHGWQTASCYGAQHLPFEVSRDVLGLLIENLRARHEQDFIARTDVANGFKPVTHTYTRHLDRYGTRRETILVQFTRETFEAEKAEHAKGFSGWSHLTFEQFRDRDVLGRDRSLQALADHIGHLQARYDAWKQTHEYRDGLWITL